MKTETTPTEVLLDELRTQAPAGRTYATTRLLRIAMTKGHSAAALTQALCDLRSAGRITLDPDKGTVCLASRIRLGEVGQPALIDGQKTKPLTFAAHAVITTLQRSGRMVGPDLIKESGCGDAVNVLRRLTKEPLWASAIDFPNGPGGKGYGLIQTHRHP